MSNSGKGDAFWALIGKLGVVAGLAVAVIGIVTWFNSPTTALRADVESGEFKLPPRYSEFQDSVESTLTPETIKTTLEQASVEGLGVKEKKDDWSLLSVVLSRLLTEKVKLMDQRIAEPNSSYWSTTVANDGELPVEGVSLRIPGSSLAVIDREDGSTSTDTTGPAIEIGTIKAGEKVKVAAWSGSFYLRSSDPPALFHSGGSGVVKIKGEFSFLEFLSDFWFPLLCGLIILAGSLVGLASAIAKQIATSASESTTSSTVVADQGAETLILTRISEVPSDVLKEEKVEKPQ